MSRMMPIIPDNIPGFKSTDDEESERDVCTEEEEEEDADEGEHEREEIIEVRCLIPCLIMIFMRRVYT